MQIIVEVFGEAPVTMPLSAFFAANSDGLDWGEEDDIMEAMANGETYHMGGGAAPAVAITPVDTCRDWFVCAYEIDRAYGGHEEGGWWYDCGTLVRTAKVFRTKAAAERYVRRANRLMAHIQRNHRSTGSVIYSGGRYLYRICRKMPEPHFPAIRPHYE